MAELRTAQPARHPDPTVKACRLAYLVWERPDLQRVEDFLCAFGLRVAHRTPGTLYLRGTAAAPYCYVVHRAPRARFVGFALELGSRDDLERIVRTVPGAGPVESLEGPGGGEVVRLLDPSGFRVDAVHGQQAFAGLPQRDPIAQFNTAAASPRINDTQRVPEGAPAVVKLGHVVLELAAFQATCAWYTRHFGLIPSDVQVLPDGTPAVAFLRLDRGEEPADHHTLALAQGLVASYSHSAFELLDADAVGMGQCVLRERGFRHAWGLGRHILGSQIFDYWQDPWGDKHEHYSDGDLFTAAVPTGVHAVSRQAMAQWGPPLPREFTRPKLSPGLVWRILQNIRRSPDLDIGKALTLARLFG
jgi:catechol 2,3-dioxygenase-like lactoylglutathione lyase family enzyme